MVIYSVVLGSPKGYRDIIVIDENVRIRVDMVITGNWYTCKLLDYYNETPSGYYDLVDLPILYTAL